MYSLSTSNLPSPDLPIHLFLLLLLNLLCLLDYTRLHHVGVAVLQGLLFAIGGYLEGKTSTDAVECYNPRTKRYTCT